MLPQKRVVGRVLQTRDYLCIQGMPGTGKTTTLAFCIRALVAKGLSVLVASHTHLAVDNVLLKVRHVSCGETGREGDRMTLFVLAGGRSSNKRV